MWTHQPGWHRRKAIQELVFHREKDPAVHFPRRPRCRVLCTHDIIALFPLVGHDERENPSSCDSAEISFHVPTSEGFEVTNQTTGATGDYVCRMSRLTRDGAAVPISRDKILRRKRGQENIHFPCSADHTNSIGNLTR